MKSRPLDFLVVLIGKSVFSEEDNTSRKDSKKVLRFQLEDSEHC